MNATTQSSPKLLKGFAAMISNRAFAAIVLSLGFGVAQIGCNELGDDGVHAMKGVGFETLNGSTIGGTNGANSIDVADNMVHIWSAGSAPFGEENEDLMKIQLASEGTRPLLSYVVACALPVGSYSINGISYEGKGLLNSTTSWLTSALSTQAKYDLMECIMAHVNPYNEEVDIRLTGDATADGFTPTEASEFSTPEALWVVYENATGLVREVWPFTTLATECESSFAADVDLRVCGSLAGEARCGVTVHMDLGNHCSQSAVTGHWSCDGHPAIKTWLRTTDIVELYPNCGE